MKKIESNNVLHGENLRIRAIGRVLILTIAVLAVAGSRLMAGTGSLDYVSGWYAAGTNLTVSALPSDVYSSFARWEGDTNGAVVAGDQLTLANLSGSKSITAVFRDSVTASNAVPYTWLNMISNNWITVQDFESAATNDFDGDGFTTAQEYWSGTDPFSSVSYLHIGNVDIANGNIRLHWSHSRVDSNIPPLTVQVRTDLLNGVWQDATVNTNTPIDGMNMWEEPYSGLRFYRLIAPAAP